MFNAHVRCVVFYVIGWGERLHLMDMWYKENDIVFTLDQFEVSKIEVGESLVP